MPVLLLLSVAESGTMPERPNIVQVPFAQTARTPGLAVRVDPDVAWPPIPIPAQPFANAGGNTEQLTVALSDRLTGGPMKV